MSRKSTFRPAAQRRNAAPRARTARPPRPLYRRPLRFESLEDRRVLAPVVVTTLADSVDLTDGLTSLREAIFATNTVPGADEITFAPSLTAGGPATILLTQGELKITDDLTITGPGRDLLTIDASGNDPTPDENNGDGSRIFNVDDGDGTTFIVVAISNLTLTGGDTSNPIIYSRENFSLVGAAVVRNSTSSYVVGCIGLAFELRDSIVSHNVGAPIAAGNTQRPNDSITISDSELSHNTMPFDDAIVWVLRTSNAKISGTRIVDNLHTDPQNAGRTGIAIYGDSANLQVTNSIVSRNQATAGISSAGQTTIANSDFSHNGGYGVHIGGGAVTLMQCNISDNGGSGIVIRQGDITLIQTTISRNEFGIDGFRVSPQGAIRKGMISIIDCVVSENNATGIYAVNHQNIDIRGCIVAGNNIEEQSLSAYDVGILVNSNVTISDTTVIGNRSGVSAISANLVMERVTVRENVSSEEGGGIRISGGTTTIRNCTIVENTSSSAGGGVYTSSGVVTVVNSEVSRNSATAGGGITVTRGVLTVVDSHVFDNSAGAGGGLWIDRSEVTLRDSSITGNFASRGGGIYCFVFGSSERLVVDRCTIAGNTAQDDAGGIFISRAPATIRNSRISGNTANGNGGGIWTNGSVSIIACDISGNAAQTGAEPLTPGAAPTSGGGIWSNGELSIFDSTISGNSADLGGGVSCLNPGSAIVNCTISGNSASVGGGVYGRCMVENSTIAANTATISGGGISGNGNEIILRNSIVAKNTAPLGRDLTGVIDTTFSPSHSLIGSNQHSGLTQTAPGTPDANGNLIGGTFGIDPKLAPLADNGGQTMPDGTHRLTHALLPGSPAIDAGDPAAVAGVGGVPIHDGRGAPFTRVYGGRIDIGAFELQPTDVLVGDYNQNGIVDSGDYTVWRNTLGSTVPPGTAADGNRDGRVDRLDYDLWKANFGSTTANLGPVAPAIAVVELPNEPDSPTATAISSVQRPAQNIVLAPADFRPASHSTVIAKAAANRIEPALNQRDQALLAWFATRYVGGVSDADVRDDQPQDDCFRDATPGDASDTTELHSLDRAFASLM